MHKICTSERENGRCMTTTVTEKTSTRAIHSVNDGNPAVFGGGKTDALGVKTTADPRGTARAHWAARGKPSHPTTDEIIRHSHPPNSPTIQSGISPDRRELGGQR